MFFILISESGLEHSIKNGMKYKQGVIKFTVKQLQSPVAKLVAQKIDLWLAITTFKMTWGSRVRGAPENLRNSVHDGH